MDRVIKILHLEDSDLDAELLVSQLEAEKIKCTMTRVFRKNEFINLIEKEKFDIILSDNTMPDFDGIDALRLAKKIQPDTPFIFLSGTINEEVAIEAMRWGASDYVLKQKLSKLGVAVRRVIQESDQKEELELANIKIRESEDKYRVITENSADAIFITDKNGRYTYINFSAVKMLGYSKEEILKFTIGDLSPDDKKEEYLEFFKKLFQIGHIFIEIKLKKKDGQLLPVDLNAVVLPNGMVHGSCRDITERKVAEEEVLKAKDKAEEMSRLKSYFLSNMSHELRTPMVSILGFAELLRAELSNPEQLELIEHLIEGSHRLSATLNSILELSKVEASQSELNLKLCNIADEIEKKIGSLANLAKRKNLYLRTEIPDRTIAIEIDPDLFGNALLHILENSLKFTNQGGVVVQAKIQKIKDEPRLVIKVIDTGIGISDADLGNIFSEFRQASEGFSRDHEGVGVGLTIAKKIIEMLNGEIWVESKLGKGTTFFISFALGLSETQITREIREKRKTTSVQKPSLWKKKPTILIVEDNILNREVAKLYLKDNFETAEAADGVTALAVASNIHFDIVLMDINLGKGLDGINTMQRMRNIPNYKNTPIIAVTAYVMANDKEKFIELGFDGYIPKPYTKEILLKAIKQKLNTNN